MGSSAPDDDWSDLYAPPVETEQEIRLGFDQTSSKGPAAADVLPEVALEEAAPAEVPEKRISMIALPDEEETAAAVEEVLAQRRTVRQERPERLERSEPTESRRSAAPVTENGPRPEPAGRAASKALPTAGARPPLETLLPRRRSPTPMGEPRLAPAGSPAPTTPGRPSPARPPSGHQPEGSGAREQPRELPREPPREGPPPAGAASPTGTREIPRRPIVESGGPAQRTRGADSGAPRSPGGGGFRRSITSSTLRKVRAPVPQPDSTGLVKLLLDNALKATISHEEMQQRQLSPTEAYILWQLDGERSIAEVYQMNSHLDPYQVQSILSRLLEQELVLPV